MIKVVVVKNGVALGWFKDLIPGINCIKEACKVNGFKIDEYEIRDYDSSVLLWSGKNSNLTISNTI